MDLQRDRKEDESGCKEREMGKVAGYLGIRFERYRLKGGKIPEN